MAPGRGGGGEGDDDGDEGRGSPSPLPTRVVRDAFALHLCRPKMLSGIGCLEPPCCLRALSPLACCFGDGGTSGGPGVAATPPGHRAADPPKAPP